MANTILVGAQWGDEGKGKVIDLLTDETDVVVRSQGGNNAGHTVVDNGRQYVLHLIPSGILRRDTLCVIANGVVIDPSALVGEIEALRGQDIRVEPGNLAISDCAHMVLPYHRALDAHRDAAKGDGRIGTTKRGIGPAYGDKAARVGLRTCDMLRSGFAARVAEKVRENNEILQTLGEAPLDDAAVARRYETAAAALRPFLCNTVVLLHDAIAAGKRLLFEGAQGTFLDLDHGTYPFVTSSNTIAGGACTGSGVPPHRMDRVLGVMKAYTTRVGEGPFPTESDELGTLLHGMGREFGATTGRKRRCGWFDAVATRYAAMINGMDDLAVTNLDGLDTLESLRICTEYEFEGRRLKVPPSDSTDLGMCRPVYEECPGWKTPLGDVRRHADLPGAARRYLERICELTGARLSLVSVGAERAATIRL